jgi:hypothetical protein
MRHQGIPIILLLSILSYVSACTGKKDDPKSEPEVYKPDSQELYDAIVLQDSIFFTAYNNCDMDKQTAYFDDSLEFYHDKGGLSTSKQGVLDAIKKNICGKVTRELVKGSIEVYPIKDYGAVEMGLHKFHNKEEPNSIPHASKFILLWQNKNGVWKIKRVISLH